MQLNTVGPTGAKIMLLGEYPSPDDMRAGVPFTSWQGRLLDGILRNAGISRYECIQSFVAREFPPGGNISLMFKDKARTQPNDTLRLWLSNLKADIEKFKPNIVVCMGSFALWAMKGTWRMKDYRGYVVESSIVPEQKILTTESMFTVNKDYELSFPVIMDFKKVRKHCEFREIPGDQKVIVSDATLSEFLDYCDFLCNDPAVVHISADIETSQPNNHINRMGLSHDPTFGLSFEFLRGHFPALPQRDEVAAWTALAKVLTSEKGKVFQNAPYDVPVLWRNNGILTHPLWMDTLIAAHCLWPESKRDLGFLASICLDTEPWKHTSSETPGYYNGADAANTLAIAYVLNQEIDKFGVRDIFNHEMRQIPAASFLQLQGVKINTETQKKLIAKSASLAAEAKKSLDSLIGKDVNYNSTKQLAQLLYIDLGLPTQYKRRKKASDPRSVTTDAEALNKLARENPHPILELLLSYRKWTKQSQALGKPVSPKGRYHTSYNIAWRQKDEKGKIVEEESGTETGRWSSSASIIEPYGPGNLQNQNKFAREMYEPDEGCVLLQADYVQAEAVVVAYLTGDRKLKDIFRNKEDLHCYTASTMFGVPVESISKESHERRVGKTLRHATNYSAGPAVVAKALDIRITEAKRLLEMYLSVNPLLLVWHNRVKRKLEQDRIIITPMGRKRKFLGRWDDSLFRSAYAFEPQSTVGDLLNASMVDLYEKYGDIINLWMQLHDAIYTTPQDNHDSVKFTMEKKLECMIRELDVEGDKMIIDVDFSVGRNWKDMSDARLKDGVVEVKTKTGTNEDNKPIFSWVHYDQWSSDTKLK